jgi:molecular chaperone GrpE
VNEETSPPEDEMADNDVGSDEGAPDAEGSSHESTQGDPDAVNVPKEGTSALVQVTAQAAEYLDGWQRARAELANFKKRIERERQETYKRAAGDILDQFLDVMDDLERALADRPAEGEAATWAEGITLVHRKVKGVLESQGVETIGAQGEPFDPTIHEAISHEQVEDVDEGHVIDVVKQGYRMGDRVLRAALVRVAK